MSATAGTWHYRQVTPPTCPTDLRMAMTAAYEPFPGPADPQFQPGTGELDLEDRHALRRVAGLSTERQDVSEVEYRPLLLERVVLMGVWTEGTLASAENSLRELSLLAETAGSEV